MGNPAHILVAEGGGAENHLPMLKESGYSCESAPADSALAGLVAQKQPDVVMLAAGAGGFALVREIRSNKDARLVPVMLVNADGDSGVLDECFECGASDALEQDVDEAEILARLRPLIRLSTMASELTRRAGSAKGFGVSLDTGVSVELPAEDFRVLVVGIEEDVFKAMCPLLPGAGITFVSEPDPYRARSRMEGDQGDPFDGALLFVDPGEDKDKSLYFCHALRNDRRLFDLPLFVVSEPGAFANAAEAYAEGASIIAPSPPDCRFIGAHLRMLLRGRALRQALGRRIGEARCPATADELGDVYSADFMQSHMARLLEDTKARGTASNAILFFIPTIAEVAALYGDDASAMLRRQLADWLSSLVRVEDLVARVGTDEFVALLPETSLADTEIVRKRVIGVLHQSEFRLTGNVPVGIDVYVQSGIAMPQPGDSVETLVARASESLE